MQNLLRLTALLGALAVGIGAFGAHGLKNLVGPDQLETFNTGVRYHFYHVLALLALCALWRVDGLKAKMLTRAAWSWGIGILLFSGSLYLLSLWEVLGVPAAVLGPITPIGGVFFILGWVWLLLSPEQNRS